MRSSTGKGDEGLKMTVREEELTDLVSAATGMRRTAVKQRALPIIFAVLTVLSIAVTAQTDVSAKTVEAVQTPLPIWLKSGTVRFARFDGGPLETQKASRSAWAARFSPQDLEVLTNLYGKYGDHMVDLLQQARINSVWVTYSVGFSREDEEAQRVAVREIVGKLHAHGIKVAAYMCATTVFWESLFKDVPQSVKWIMFDSEGVPYRYSDGRDAMRFVADIDNAGWVQYQEHRVEGIIDDGLDAIFFDNPNLDAHPSSADSVFHFFDQLLDYARREKKSNIPFFTNLGLPPPFNLLNRQMDFIYAEGWVEPGAWGDQWEVSNIRRDRFAKGLNPGLKPFVTEYSHYHKGDRNDSFLGARSQKLGIAEAAAFGTSYTWDMEGPFDTALMNQDPKALESWAAISQYNGFLADHIALYADAVNVVPWVVLLPDSLDPDFDWTGGATRLDFLAKNSVLCDFKFASRVMKKDLAAYQGVIVPAYASLSADQKEMIRNYQESGGKVSVFAETSRATGLNAEILPASEKSSASGKTVQAQGVAEIISLAPTATRIELDTPSHVLANVTSVQDGGTLVVHLLNYDQAPVAGLKLKLVLGKEFQKLAGRKPTLFSPDTTNSAFQKLQWKGSTLEATLPSIDGYSVVVLQ
jgi:hypothetical protein